MRRLFTLSAMFFIVIAIVSCNDKETLNPSMCGDAGEIVSEAVDYEGSIIHDEHSGEYAIRYVVPQTYDSVIIGIACNLPDSFKKPDENLSVIFSGIYREIPNNERTGPVGTDFYYLDLTEINLID